MVAGGGPHSAPTKSEPEIGGESTPSPSPLKEEEGGPISSGVVEATAAAAPAEDSLLAAEGFPSSGTAVGGEKSRKTSHKASRNAPPFSSSSSSNFPSSAAAPSASFGLAPIPGTEATFAEQDAAEAALRILADVRVDKSECSVPFPCSSENVKECYYSPSKDSTRGSSSWQTPQSGVFSSLWIGRMKSSVRSPLRSPSLRTSSSLSLALGEAGHRKVSEAGNPLAQPGQKGTEGGGVFGSRDVKGPSKLPK